MRRTSRFVLMILPLAMLMLACGSRESDSGPIRDMLAARRAQNGPVSGVQEVKLSHDGMERTFLVHVPPGFDRSRSYPAVLVFHGGGGRVERTVDASGMSPAADANHFIAVYPISAGQPWNDGRETTDSGVDDVGYVRAVIDRLESDWSVDGNRVFAAGISSGGMFVQKLACEIPGQFAAMAVVAANMPAAMIDRCDPSRTVPMMFFSGTADPLMPFGGGEIASGRRAGSGGQVVSAAQTMQFWAREHGCDNSSAQQLPDTARDDTRVSRVDFSGCNGGDIVFYEIEGGGHTWPGMEGNGTRISGSVSHDISATAQMLQFFRKSGL